MGFKYSDSTKKIRKAHKGHFDKYIKGDNVKHKKELAQKLQKKYIEKFDYILSEQFIPLVCCFGTLKEDERKKCKEAIYLTLEYIDKILALAPPQNPKERSVYYDMLITLYERGVKETNKIIYASLSGKDKREKHLSKKERDFVNEKMGWIEQKSIKERTQTELREWINNIMQDNFNHLFDIWERHWEQNIIIKPFIRRVSQEVSKRIKDAKIDLEDRRVFVYIVQYLKNIAQKEINKRKFKIEIKDCKWSKEWIENLRYYEFQKEVISCNISKFGIFSLNMEYKLEDIKEKRYLGENKEFEKELLKYLKEITREYLANTQSSKT